MSIRHVFDDYILCTPEHYDPPLNARMTDYNMFIMYAALADDKCASRQPPLS